MGLKLVVAAVEPRQLYPRPGVHSPALPPTQLTAASPGHSETIRTERMQAPAGRQSAGTLTQPGSRTSGEWPANQTFLANRGPQTWDTLALAIIYIRYNAGLLGTDRFPCRLKGTYRTRKKAQPGSKAGSIAGPTHELEQ